MRKYSLRASQWRLSLYCDGVTLLAVAGVLMGASAHHDASFEVIDAQRINIREPDGTLRLVVSNAHAFPRWLHEGRGDRRAQAAMAGMLFLNDEGTESSGLFFNGALGKDGCPDSGLSLTFDRYQQDQQLQLLGLDGPQGTFAGLMFIDVADGMRRPMFSADDGRLAKAGEEAITRRVFLGKSGSRIALLQLLDAKGNPCLQLQVTPKGEAPLAFLDEAGETTRVISASDP